MKYNESAQDHLYNIICFIRNLAFKMKLRLKRHLNRQNIFVIDEDDLKKYLASNKVNCVNCKKVISHAMEVSILVLKNQAIEFRCTNCMPEE